MWQVLFAYIQGGVTTISMFACIVVCCLKTTGCILVDVETVPVLNWPVWIICSELPVDSERCMYVHG